MKEISYVYIRSFKWSSPEQGYQYDGLPAIGKVYRALRNSNNNSYELVIYDNPPGTLLLLESLVCNDDTRGYTSEIDEISLDNVLSIPLKEEDLIQLNKWEESGNKDLLEANKPTEISLMPVLANLAHALDTMGNEKKAADEVSELLLYLKTLNTSHFEIIMEVVEELIEINVSEIDETGTPTTLTKSLEAGPNGLGFNVGKCLEHLQTYSGKDRRTNEDRYDVIAAMVALTRELERRKLLDLDEE